MTELYHGTQQPLFDDSDSQGSPRIKRCCRCRIEKSLDEFYPRPRSSDGYQSYCKECGKAATRKYNKEHSTRLVLPEPVNGGRVCSKCIVEKPFSEFYEKHGACKECIKAATRNYHKEHSTRVRPVLPEPINGGKVCSKCVAEKPFSEFYESRDGKGGYLARCKECTTAEVRRYNQEHYVHLRPVLPEPVSGGKVCRKCHTEKPFGEFSRSAGKSDGYASRCKECRNRQHAEKARARGARLRLPKASNGGKVCTRCRTEKPFDAFQRMPKSVTGYNPQCKDCLNGQGRTRYKTLYREQKLSKNREWYDSHRDQHRALTMAWRQENRLKSNAYGSRRRAQQKGVTIGEIDYEHILGRDGEFCYICEGVILPEHSIEFDHVIPITRGGPHSEENIKVVHLNCNRRKHNKLLEEMSLYQRRGVK